MITSAIYGKMFESAFAGLLDLTSETTIKAAFALVAYTPVLDTDQFFDVAVGTPGHEPPPTGGYVDGGFVLLNTVISYTGVGNIFTFVADNVSISSSTIANVRSVVVYENTGLFPLICYNKSDADISTTGGTFTVAWSASGIVRIEVGAEA